MALEIEQERIDSGDLSEYEMQYLRDRGRWPVTQENGPKYTPLEEQSIPTIAEPGGVQDSEDGEEEDYEEGWNNDQRRTELARRKLSVDGTKSELIARLRRSDTDQLNDDDYSTLED